MRKEMERTADEILAQGRDSVVEFDQLGEYYYSLIGGMEDHTRDWASSEDREYLEGVMNRLEEAWFDFKSSFGR